MKALALTHILEYSVLGRRVKESATVPLQLGSRENAVLSSLLPSGTPIHGDGCTVRAGPPPFHPHCRCPYRHARRGTFPTSVLNPTHW